MIQEYHKPNGFCPQSPQSCKQGCATLGSISYQQVAYIGILNEDDTLKIGIPLYVKVSGDMSAQRRKMIQDIATEMIRKYDKQISEYFQKLKKEQRQNESIVSG